MEHKDIISEYMRGLAKKSAEVRKDKYGKEYYSAIANKRWKKYREEKGENDLDIVVE